MPDHDSITLDGVRMTVRAARLVEETGSEVYKDVSIFRRNLHLLSMGLGVRHTHNSPPNGFATARAALLADCLDGVEDDDRREGWHEYVDAIAAHCTQL